MENSINYKKRNFYKDTDRADAAYDYAKGYYVVAFDKFTASQMSVPFTAVVRNANGEAVSQILTYSVESYAASKQNDASVGALVKAMMKYGDSVSTWWSARS